MEAALECSLRPTGSVWDAAQWQEALGSYARATSLAVSVYAADGHRRIGPLVHQPIAQMLSACGAFDEGGQARRFEELLVAECLARRAEVTRHFEGALVVSCRPAIVGGVLHGAFVSGWVFSRFPDPLLTERIARAVGLPSNRFWLASREHLPVSAEKFAVYASLLTTLSGAILEQHTVHRALLDADRMKDEFLSTLSHELRTPLTSVQLRLQALVRSLPREDSRVTQALDAIQSGLRSQARLINELLDTSRILTGKMSLELRPVNLSRVVRAAAETVQPMAAAKGIELGVRAAETTRNISADAERLQQMFWNLLVNGVKFTPAGGRVSIELLETTDCFEVVVRDTGDGIDGEFLPFVFDRFAQGRNNPSGSQRGLGLGLALVRYIAELHGGSVRVESDGPGRGSTFRVQLPAPRG